MTYNDTYTVTATVSTEELNREGWDGDTLDEKLFLLCLRDALKAKFYDDNTGQLTTANVRISRKLDPRRLRMERPE